MSSSKTLNWALRIKEYAAKKYGSVKKFGEKINLPRIGQYTRDSSFPNFDVLVKMSEDVLNLNYLLN